MQFDKTGLESYITDAALESQVGIWVDFPGDRSFHILRAGGANKKFVRAFSAAVRPYRRQMEKGTMDPDLSEKLMRQVYAQHVIKDWSGIKDDEKREIPFSPRACVEFLEAFPEVFNEIVILATEAATFSGALVEEASEVLGET